MQSCSSTDRSSSSTASGLLVDQQDQFFAGFSDYLQTLDSEPPSLNAVFQVGHTSLRADVMDSFGWPATVSEM